MKFEVVLGFNTKQWWVWEDTEGFYIDPPTAVLNSLPDWRENPVEAEREFKKIVDSNPDWLYDKEYWYDDAVDI